EKETDSGYQSIIDVDSIQGSITLHSPSNLNTRDAPPKIFNFHTYFLQMSDKWMSTIVWPVPS
ncbi:Kinesin-like protein, partial [Caligus rogercresseyi]